MRHSALFLDVDVDDNVAVMRKQSLPSVRNFEQQKQTESSKLRRTGEMGAFSRAKNTSLRPSLCPSPLPQSAAPKSLSALVAVATGSRWLPGAKETDYDEPIGRTHREKMNHIFMRRHAARRRHDIARCAANGAEAESTWRLRPDELGAEENAMRRKRLARNRLAAMCASHSPVLYRALSNVGVVCSVSALLLQSAVASIDFAMRSRNWSSNLFRVSLTD